MGGSGSNPNRDKDPPSALRSRSEDPPAEIRIEVLIVEDNEADVFLIEEAIAATELPISIHIAQNGERAIQFFELADRLVDAPCPALVILDINLPKRPGQEVLRHLRESPRCGKARVIVVSTSDSVRDRQQMAELGAETYFHKPSEYADFMKLGDLIKGALKP